MTIKHFYLDIKNEMKKKLRGEGYQGDLFKPDKSQSVLYSELKKALNLEGTDDKPLPSFNPNKKF